MNNITPISEISGIRDALESVTIGTPLVLTDDGQPCYAVIDIADLHEYEKLLAGKKLMHELQKGRSSGEGEGWLSDEQVARYFAARYNG